MKRVAVILGILSFAAATVASAATQTAQQSPAASSQSTSSQTPAQGQSAGQTGTTGTAAAPAGKRPPQAKTQPEFDAYKVAAGSTDPAALEKAADDFATKFPDSELRVLL